MDEMLAGHVLVDGLVMQGVTHVVGVPGESELAAFDGFHARAERIRFVTCRQEGSAACMAEPAGELTSRPGVCFVTCGASATIASIGAHAAFQDSTPMVLFIGEAARDVRDREAFQALNFPSFSGPSTVRGHGGGGPGAEPKSGS